MDGHKAHDTRHKASPSACRASRGSRGMTLVEVIIWTAVFTIIILAITSSILYFYRTNRYALEQSSAVSSSQRGVGKIVRIVREAAYSSDGAYPIVSIAANDLVFYADTDADPLIERVHYFLSGTNLMEGTVDASGDPPGYGGAETASTLSDYVRNVAQNVSTFNYYDQSGTEITDYSNRTAVRFVKVNVVINVDPNKLPNQLTLSSSAALRNLK